MKSNVEYRIVEKHKNNQCHESAVDVGYDPDETLK